MAKIDGFDNITNKLFYSMKITIDKGNREWMRRLVILIEI